MLRRGLPGLCTIAGLLLTLELIWPSRVTLSMPSRPVLELVRGWETIVLTPRELPELRGVASARLRCYAWRDHFVPVPFQIDEVSSSGSYLLPQGPQAETPHGDFTGLDELVFLASALAARAPDGAAPPCPGGLTLPVPIGRAGDREPAGWVYLARCSPDTPRASQDHAALDPASGTVSAGDHRLGFDTKSPMIPTQLRFFPTVRGTGQDLLNGIFVLGQVRLLGGMLRITRTIEDFRSNLSAWSDGAVRVIRRTPARARTIGDHYTNPGTFMVDSIQQPGKVAFDVQLHTTHDISAYLNDMVMVVAWDFSRFSGMAVHVPGSATRGVVDGFVTADERTLRARDATWIYTAGPQGSYLGQLLHAPELPVVRQLHYDEGKGGQLLLGYRLSGLHRLARGRTVFRAQIVNLGGADLEAGRALAIERARPLTRLSH